MRAVLLTFALVAAGRSAVAQAPILVNTDDAGLALQGYDPVAFFTLNQPVAGSTTWQATWRGATYRFSSPDHKALFEQDPAKYEPAFGGYCAYGVSQGGLFPIDVTTFQILHGRLVLNKNPRVRELFDQEREKRFRMAEREWPAQVEKKGRRG